MKRVFITIIFSVAVLSSCSTASRLSSPSPMLVHNKVSINGDADIKPASVIPYIKQQAPGFVLFAKNKEIFDPSLVSSSVESIRNHMNYEGYYNSEVNAFVITKPSGKTTVQYNITPGKRYRIKNVVFDVPEGEFRRDFYLDTANVTIKAGDYLSEERIEKESERSASYMHTKGYFGFTKAQYVFEADTLFSSTGEADLTIMVRDYSRGENPERARALLPKSIDSVSITHNSSIKFRDNILRDLNTITPGELYNEANVRRTYDRLSHLKLFSSVAVNLSENEKGNVDCNILLTESKLQGISVDFDASTNSSGLIGLSPQVNWYHKNIFHGGELLNLSFMGDFQFEPGTTTRANEFGVSSNLSIPRFLGFFRHDSKSSSMPNTEIVASFNFQDRPEYRRRIASVSFGYSGVLKERFQYQFYPVQLNQVRIFDMDPNFYANLAGNPLMRYSYQDHFDAGVGGVVHYASASGLNPKQSYWYTRLSMDLSGNILALFRPSMKRDDDGNSMIFGTPFTQYVRAEWTLGKNIRFGRNDRQAIAMRALFGAGYAYGNSAALPFEKQFYAGGANSMRGWQARSLGPGSMPASKFFIIPSQTGDIKIEANLEYRFGMFWKIEGALFTDIGNVWGLNTEDDGCFGPGFLKTLAADWGLGVRCDLDFIILRVDFGVKMVDPTLPEGHRWVSPSSYLKADGNSFHFGVGYPF